MGENKPKHPPTETTQDDSSDVEQVRLDKQGPPPEPKAAPEKNQEIDGSEEEREAEKGHS